MSRLAMIWFRLRRAWRTARWLPGLAVAALLASACQEVDGPEANEGTVQLQIGLANVLSGETLEIRPYYLRENLELIPLEVLELALETGPNHTHTVEIEIDRCLTDGAREGNNAACPLRLGLLLRNSARQLLDSILLGPLNAVPGGTLTPPALALRHPDTIVLSAEADSVVAGATLAVGAQVIDRVGVPMTGARLVWSSSNPQVATIDQNGVVTGVSPGSVVVSARLEELPDGPTDDLPLTVRGGVAVTIGPAGGTVYSRDGSATLVIPAGALSTPTAIQMVPNDTLRLRPRFIPGRTFRLLPDGLVFAVPATLTISYPVAAIPGGAVQEPIIRLLRVWHDSLRRIAGSTVNTTGHLVSGLIDGTDSYGPMVATIGAQTLSHGFTHACSVLATGLPICYGTNEFGQLGDGTLVGNFHTYVLGGHGFSTIEAGTHYSCGLTTAGAVYCWGLNDVGQLGNGTTLNALVPQAVLLPGPMTSISTGTNSACATDASGNVWCWGSAQFQQLGVTGTATCGAIPCRPTPAQLPASNRVSGMSSGSGYRCGVAPDVIGCWGLNNVGQLGVPAGPGPLTPVAPPPGAPGPFVQLDAGSRHTCGLVASGAAYCWGTSLFGAMGDGNTEGHTTTGVATAVTGGVQFAMLTISRSDTPLALTCGVSLAGDGYCWGSHSRFALGTTATLPVCTFQTFGPFPCSATPVPVTGGLKYHEIHASVSRACGRTLAAEIWCWGAIPFASDKPAPSRVP